MRGSRIDVLKTLATVERLDGNTQRARVLYETAIKRAEELGDRAIALDSIWRLAVLYDLNGEHALAKDYFEECLLLARKRDERRIEATAYAGLGGLELTAGHIDKARPLTLRALAGYHELNAGWAWVGDLLIEPRRSSTQQRDSSCRLLKCSRQRVATSRTSDTSPR